MSYLFCRIIVGELEGSVVYRDDLCTAFMDAQPVNPGHLLVVPNAHTAGLANLSAATGARMFQTAQRLAAALRASELRYFGKPPGAVLAQAAASIRTALPPE